MNQINNSFNFYSLHEEVRSKILLNLDLNTQYKISSTCQLFYENLNKNAEAILLEESIRRNNTITASKDLAQYHKCNIELMLLLYFKVEARELLTNEIIKNNEILDNALQKAKLKIVKS